MQHLQKMGTSGFKLLNISNITSYELGLKKNSMHQLVIKVCQGDFNTSVPRFLECSRSTRKFFNVLFRAHQSHDVHYIPKFLPKYSLRVWSLDVKLVPMSHRVYISTNANCLSCPNSKAFPMPRPGSIDAGLPRTTKVVTCVAMCASP